MRILVLSNEVWNDKINGNNVTSNWFDGMDAEFANIYASPEAPYNTCCNHYFQITDKMMLKSIISHKAGKILEYKGNKSEIIAEEEPKQLYGALKRISGSMIRFLREVLWLLGRYDEEGIQKFIDNFNPDIIFSERKATCKMLRLEKTILKLSNAPIVAFTGDDEYSLKVLRISPFFWINRFMTRSWLRSLVTHYNIYYTLSKEQKEMYEKLFNCRMKLLYKTGEFSSPYKSRPIHSPIRMIYAGKFYCNRWKVLAEIASVISEINKERVKIVLEIYTRDTPTRKQKMLLDDKKSSFIMGGVTQEELSLIYKQSDIALHVESCDIKNRLDTRLSFSTKIVDCISSGCAVLAYCWEEHSGYTYLQREEAAICVSSKDTLRKKLIEIVNNPQIIPRYALNAYRCGERNHDREKVQQMLLDDFAGVIQEGRL